MSMCAHSAPALVSPNHTLTSAAPQSGGTTPNRYVSHPPQPLTHAQPKPAAGGGRTQCLSGRCQRPEVRRLCPGEQQKGTRRPGEHAGGWGSAFSSSSVWYFSAILGPVPVLSGLLPFLRILLPKLLTEVAVGFSVAPGLRPTQPSPLSTSRPMRLPTVSEVSRPKSRKLISSCKSDQSTTKQKSCPEDGEGHYSPLTSVQ